MSSFFLLLSLLSATLAFSPCRHRVSIKRGRRFSNVLLHLLPDNDEQNSTLDRRSLLKKGSVAAAVTTGLVWNKYAIEGPKPFTPAPESLMDKVIVITGGNTGLGLESAKRLAMGGATIVITSRSSVKGTLAVQAIEDYTFKHGVINNKILSLPLDLCDLTSVHSFPTLLKQSAALNNGTTRTVDVLLNNAGVMAIPDYQLTKDGYERQFQTNYLGHFALTALLFPLLNPNGSRVINVSSAAYQLTFNGLDMKNLNGEKSYNPWIAYSMSKFENILFTKELQRRADASSIGKKEKKVVAISLHPGVVRTDLARYIIGDVNVSLQEDANKFANFAKTFPLMYFTKGVERGANTQIWLAAGQGNDNDVAGKYFQNLKETKVARVAENLSQAKELWTYSEKLSGVVFDI